MIQRLRLLLVLLGAIAVVAVFTYPQWRPAPALNLPQEDFPELSPEFLDAFQLLPLDVQRQYLAMRERNAIMAVDLVLARLDSGEPLPEEEQAPPDLTGTVIAAEGEFGPVALLDEDDERDMPPYADLHTASGTVMVYQSPSAEKVLRIEDLNVSNGPSLSVFLVRNPAPLTAEDLGDDFLDLGPLKASSGSMNYNVPTEATIGAYGSVVIFDRRYRIVFAVARLG